MNEKHPEPEPTEHFTLFAYTSKHIRASYYNLIDYSSKEFRATRAEAIAKARAYFQAIQSNYKSVTLLTYGFRAGKLIEQPIFSESTI